MIRFAAAVILLVGALVFASPVRAQTTTPAPSAAPFAGFSGRGTLAIEAAVSANVMSLKAEVAVMSAKRRIRIDLLRLDVSPKDSPAGAMLTALLPKGPVTFVYDLQNAIATVWSTEKRAYYQLKIHSLPKRKAYMPATSPIDQILGATKAITEYDLLNQSIALVGHQPVNGHPSTVLHYAMQSQKHGEKLQDISGDLALADDLSGIPIRLWATLKGKREGTIKLDLLSAQLAPPADSVFAVPAGFKRVKELKELFGSRP